MIKRINVFLAVGFALLLAMKGLKSFKESRAKGAKETGQPVVERPEASDLALRVYYGIWSGYAQENPISNRNGVLLDIVRAIFPKATFHHVHGDVERFATLLKADPQAVVIGFGKHPALDGCSAAPTPIMSCPISLMTLRTNQWQYKDFSSLTNLRIVADKALLDYKVIRRLHEEHPKNIRLMPSNTSKTEFVKLVENGAADAFVLADLRNAEGMIMDVVSSVRFLQRFRRSKPIANDGTLFYVSSVDPDFGKKIIDEYESGFRRISKDGHLRRIFEYYGMTAE